MLKKAQRITSSRLISLLFKKGKVYKNKAFIIRFLPSLYNNPQFAVIVSKKVDSKAVGRNLIKRRVSELIRLNLNQLPSPIVALVMIKSSVTPYSYSILKQEILNFLSHYQQSTHV